MSSLDPSSLGDTPETGISCQLLEVQVDSGEEF